MATILTMEDSPHWARKGSEYYGTSTDANHGDCSSTGYPAVVETTGTFEDGNLATQAQPTNVHNAPVQNYPDDQGRVQHAVSWP